MSMRLDQQLQNRAGELQIVRVSCFYLHRCKFVYERVLHLVAAVMTFWLHSGIV